MTILFFVLLVLTLIVIAIIRFDIHPFLALFVGAVLYGLLTGMPVELILQSITEGFGGVIGKIGLVILLGVVIGTFLEKTGGAFVIAQRVLAWIGEKSIVLAMMITGWILSIPIFADSAFVIMNPINKSLSFKSKVPYVATTVALTLGLTASHSLVPPTPGPIATAGMLDADLGTVILWGAIVSTLALIPSFFFVKYYVTRFHLAPQLDEIEESTVVEKVPSLGKSALPIFIPLVLIVLGSIAAYPTRPFGAGAFASTLLFLGEPVMALLIGAFLSFFLPAKFDIKLLSSTGWIGESVLLAAPIILITGAGGIFGMMLRNSGIAELVSNSMAHANWGLFLPFLMALALKTAQGSSTVAMITTASIIAPLLPVLGLDTDILKVFSVLAIGCGAMAISHANDSFFWVMTQMTGMKVKMANQTHSLATLVLSCSAIVLLYLFSLII